MPLASFFLFGLKLHVISLNLIASIISIETEASLLALTKSIYYFEFYATILMLIFRAWATCGITNYVYKLI